MYLKTQRSKTRPFVPELFPRTWTVLKDLNRNSKLPPVDRKSCVPSVRHHRRRCSGYKWDAGSCGDNIVCQVMERETACNSPVRYLGLHKVALTSVALVCKRVSMLRIHELNQVNVRISFDSKNKAT